MTPHPWTPWRRATKRIIDLGVAAVALVVCSPILVVITAVIRLAMGSPVLYTQQRIGSLGRGFRIYKFRTMVQQPDVETTVTTADDERITSVGRFLRRTKLDELPQLWNVVRGDMSLVGPRPDVEGFADLLRGDDRLILRIRPGLTGPASIVFRYEEELLAAQNDPEEYNRSVLFPLKVRLNRAYAQHSTLVDDVRYVLWTLRPPRQATIDRLMAST